ncbi:MAG: UDP-N-acetylmuramoyl-tripeptide--D-alanyl-D-alanine ligase [Bryobacteraceae bacterium]
MARVVGSGSEASGAVSGFSIDSRTVMPGDLFFALPGENSDGHRYLAQAFERGAAAAVVDQNVETAGLTLKVADTLRALQELARWARNKWGGKVVGVTGSAGKTSTKDVIAALLEPFLRVGKTVGNFNNHIGLPLSILRLPDDAEVAVLEMGMNHAGEIRDLAAIARPDVGVVTNVGTAHIECFESVEGIALAKKELIDALPADGGIAVLNHDDDRVRHFNDGRAGKVISFGIGEGAAVRAEDVTLLDNGVSFRVGGARFSSSLPGRHGIRNILAGIAVAEAFDIRAAKLEDAVRSLAPGKMRGERLEHNGITIFNDCYNSNPDAARAMLEVLRETSGARHIAVLGEMLELGRWSEPLHREVGRYAAACEISVLVGIHGAARAMVDAAVEAGLPENAAYFLEDPVEAGILLRKIAERGDVILFKGSRGTRVEKALEEFLK